MSLSDAFIDPETGRRVHRISRQGGESASWYFHNYPFLHKRDTSEDDKLVYRGKTDKGWQLFSVNLQTLEYQQVTDIAHNDTRLTEVRIDYVQHALSAMIGYTNFLNNN